MLWISSSKVSTLNDSCATIDRCHKDIKPLEKCPEEVTVLKNEIKSSFDSANLLISGMRCDSYILSRNIVPTKTACHLTKSRPKIPVKSLNFTTNYKEQE